MIYEVHAVAYNFNEDDNDSLVIDKTVLGKRNAITLAKQCMETINGQSAIVIDYATGEVIYENSYGKEKIY